MIPLLSKYKNGNTSVWIFMNGTKIRESDENPNPEYPESVDIKITNYCENECPFCHESSSRNGEHADLDFAAKYLESVPIGMEVAIGGGNPLSHPDLKKFVNTILSQGKIPNITVNSSDLSNEVNSLGCFGIGVSWNRKNDFIVEKYWSENSVIHLIAGVHSVDDLRFCLEKYKKVLVLGYKSFGRGILSQDKYVGNINRWKESILSFIGMGVLSFDNLAISQLNIKDCLSEEQWSSFYLGDDGCFSMYVDFVKKEYALSSISERKLLRSTLKECFDDIKVINS